MRKEVELGDKVKDPVTGYSGTAVAKTTWLYGCDRISVQQQGMDKEGNLFPTQSFDEPQLDVVKRKSVKIANKVQRKNGGPRANVFQKEGVMK